MASATLEIDEYNQNGVVTRRVTNLNAGSVDMPNIKVSPATSIRIGSPSFTKYHRLRFTYGGAGTLTVGGLKVWLSTGTFATGEVIATNLAEAGTYAPAAFSRPTQTPYGGAIMPTVEPVSANLGIGGVVTGTLALTPSGAPASGSSDYWLWQVQTSASTPPGALPTKEYSFSWSET